MSIAFVLAGLTLGLSPVAAQTRTIDPGTRVRIRLETQSRPFVAMVAALRPDTLVLVRGVSRLDPETPFAVSEIAELEVSAGRRRLTFIGAGVGILTGLVVTAAYNGIVQSQCFSDCPDKASLPIGMLAGGLTFGIGFHFVRSERWLRIALPERVGLPR